MSFGFSPSDVVKLVQVSTRVYLAFKGGSDVLELPLMPLTDSTQMRTTTRKRRSRALCASSRLSMSVSCNSVS